MNNESQVLNLPIEDIIPNRFQPRLNFDDEGLQELANSIKEHGIIQPLVVRKVGEKYEIIAGERRYKASKMAGLTTVPAIISEMDDKKSAEVAIVENIQRRDLTAIEEAKSYEALLSKGYLTQEELAQKMGLSQSAISNKLRLLSLSENIQNALMKGQISERHARSLLSIKDKEEQDKWLKIIIDERLTVKELDNRLKKNMKEENNNAGDTPIKIEPEITKKETKNSSLSDLFNKPEENIPNKFFNFLEDEQANMNTSEQPVIPKVEANSLDDVEMLDFSPAINVPTKDMSIAKNLVDNLKNELQNNSYTITILEDDNKENIKYTITISKE